MSLTEDQYNPEVKTLQKYFHTKNIHLNFPFNVPQTQGKFDPERFNTIVRFCEKWDINISLASNLYWIIDRMVSAKVLDAFQGMNPEAVASNSSHFRDENQFRKLTDAPYLSCAL